MMVVVLNLPFKAKPFGDMNFHREAKNLALYLKGAVDYDQVTITQAPGPVFYYAPVYVLVPLEAQEDQYWYYAVTFSFVMMTISMLMIYRIGTNFFRKEIGLLTVLLFFIFPIHCYYNFGVAAESPAFFAIALALYGWSKVYFQPDKKSGWIILILGLWFLIMNRPNTVLILAFGFLIVFYAYFKRKDFFKTYGKKLGTTFLIVGFMGFGTLMTAKSITAKKSPGDQENLFYYVAHLGRFQFREEITDFRFWDNDIRSDSYDYQNWVKSIEDLDQRMLETGMTHKEVYREFLVQDVFDNPYWFTRQFFVKCFYGHVYFINSVKPDNFKLGPIHGPIGYWFVILLINSINILILFGAFLFLWKQKNLINYWPFWAIIIALLIFHGLTYMEPRYMFPARVALYIMSAAGLYKLGWVQKSIGFVSKFVFPVNKSIS